MIVLLVIIVLVVVGIFVFEKIKKLNIEEYLKAEGFENDCIFYQDYDYLAIDIINKKIALGCGKEKNIYNYSDIISWQREPMNVTYGQTFKPVQNAITVIVKDIKNPIYQIKFSTAKKLKECFDMMEVALKL